MPIIDDKRYTTDDCLVLFEPKSGNEKILRRFFMQMENKDLTCLYHWHERVKHWFDIEEDWQLYCLSGDIKILNEWLQTNPTADIAKDSFHRNIAHFAAWGGNTECLFTILDKFPALISGTTSGNHANIAHYAAWSGNLKCLFDLLDRCPELSSKADRFGMNIAHYAAKSGNTECLFTVLDKYPALADSVDRDNCSIAHFAAWSGNTESLFAVLDRYPKLENGFYDDHHCIAYITDKIRKPECLKAALLRYPDWIYPAERYAWTYGTSFDMRKVIVDVKQTLEKRNLAARAAKPSPSSVAEQGLFAPQGQPQKAQQLYWIRHNASRR